MVGSMEQYVIWTPGGAERPTDRLGHSRGSGNCAPHQRATKLAFGYAALDGTSALVGFTGAFYK
jgi:hypothetical protein